MQNFIFLAQLDVSPVMPGLMKLKPETWPGVPERGETGNPMIGLGASITLRGHETVSQEAWAGLSAEEQARYRARWLEDGAVADVGTLEKWPTMQRLLAEARAIIMATSLGQELLTGEPGRAMLSRLDPGSTIFWHVDDGEYHRWNARFHIPLVTNLGCLSYSGPEVVHMPVGCLYFFNNKPRHSSANWGRWPRTHAIFEMRTKAPRGG